VKKLLIAFAVLATVTLPIAAMADPPTEPPGQGDCNHGNSGQTCVPDPQPTHGQDCDEHGPNEGGVNEDLCLTTTPTQTLTTATETTTTETTTTAVTTTTVTTPSTSAPPVTTTISTPPTSTVTDTPTTTTTAPIPGATTVSPPKQQPSNEANGPNKKIPQTSKLAFTGVENVVPIGAVALVLLTGGSGLLWFGRRKDDE